MAVKYPATIKSVVTKLTNSIQKSLQSRQSRIEVELPPAAEYGVEQKRKERQRQQGESDAQLVSRSNREAARLITEMFAVLAPTTTVLFPTEDEAQQVRTQWGRQFKGQVLAMDVKKSKGMGNLRSRRFSQQEQEAALLGDDSTGGVYVPDGTEVLVVVGPRGKDLKRVVRLHERFGEGTLIILLNARLAAAGADFLSESKSGDSDEEPQLTGTAAAATALARVFVNAFHYAPPAVQEKSLSGKELLLYHEFNGKWYVAEQDRSSSSSSSGGGGGFLEAVGSALSGGGGGSGFVTRWEGEQRPDEATVAQALEAKAASDK